MAAPTTKLWHPILLGTIVLFALIELGLTGYERHRQHNFPIDGSAFTGRINYLIFLSVWTLLLGSALLFLGNAAKFGRIASWLSHIAWAGLTWFFWLIGAAIYSARVDQYSCGETAHRCDVNHAVEAFAWMEVILTFFLIFGAVFTIGKKTERYKEGPYDAEATAGTAATY